MEPKRLIELTVGIVVGLVVFSAILMPVVSNAQINNGDPITKTNDQGDYNLYMREIKDGDTLEVIVSEGVTTAIRLNGVPLMDISESSDFSAYHSYIYSDVFGVNTGSNSTGLQVYTTESTTVSYTSSATVTYNEGTFTITTGGTSYEYPGATWGFIACNADEAEYYESVRSGNTAHYIKSDKDIVCCGVYTTGDNDTFYTYYNGIANVAQDYECSATITKTLAEGTTDIYLANIEFNVGDESFVPYRVMIPLEVTGHADSGTMYEMLGVIPILIIAGLIIGIVGVALSRRE